MEAINIKNIGFKKYMDILEDVQRNFNNNRLYVSMHLDTLKYIRTFYQGALSFATDSEINMYKHKANKFIIEL